MKQFRPLHNAVVFGLLFLLQSERLVAQQSKTISIVLTQPYTDTGLQIAQGETVTVSASGTMNWFTGSCPVSGACVTTPAGHSCPYTGFFAEGLPCWSLIGAIGKNGKPFEVGTSITFTAASPGEFFLGVNDNVYSDNTGSWTAIVKVSAALETCATNASVNLAKIHVTPSSLWSQWNGDNFFYLQPGNRLLFPFFNKPWPPYGIQINVDSDAVTYTGLSVPYSDITFKFIQNLNAFTGYAIYQEVNGTPQKEWMAILAELNGSHLVGPLVDDNDKNPPYYDQYSILNDSPAVHAPLHDSQGRPLTALHYTKTFTAYYGCHTNADLTTYPSTDSRHFLHTLAKVTWGVNYFGEIPSCVFCGGFAPDPTTGPPYSNTNPGIFYNQSELSADEMIVVAPPTANGNTNFICFGGGVCQ